MTFEVGDVVQLKSGGPAMTVEEIDEQHVNVVWFDEKNKQERGYFAMATLVSYDPKSMIPF